MPVVRSSVTSVETASVDVQARATPAAGAEPAVPAAGRVTWTLGMTGAGLGPVLGAGDGVGLGEGLGDGKVDGATAAVTTDETGAAVGLAVPLEQPAARSMTAIRMASRVGRLGLSSLRRVRGPWGP